MNDQERRQVRQSAGYLAPGFRERVAADIGARIRQARESAGMTHEQVEQLTGFKATMLAKVEQGYYPPKLVTELYAIAQAIGCHIEVVKN